MKLNTDGLFVGNPGVVGCGGVVRDDRDKWVARFTRRIRLTSSFVAELWGLKDGLMMCCNLNISSHLVVKLDAKSIVDVLGKFDYVNNVISLILYDWRLLASCFYWIKFNYNYRQANRCANRGNVGIWTVFRKKICE